MAPTAPLSETSQNLIRELRPRCGEQIEVRTRTGLVSGMLLSACVSGLWLIADGDDVIVGVADVLSHTIIS